LQVVKLFTNSSVEWEMGADRSLTVPQLPQLLHSCAALQVSCTYSNTAGTRIQLETKAEQVEVRFLAAIAWLWSIIGTPPLLCEAATILARYAAQSLGHVPKQCNTADCAQTV